MKRFVKDQDLFGHPVMLSFNHRGTTHQTSCGGVVSIFIKAFIVFYMYVNFTKLIFRGDDKFGSVLCGTIDMIGRVPLNKAKPMALMLKKSRE